MVEMSGIPLKVDPRSSRIKIPKEMQQGLVDAFHSELGASTIASTIAHVFHWKAMKADATRCVQACTICAKRKDCSVKYGKVPSKMVTVHPRYEVAIAPISPFSKQQFRDVTALGKFSSVVSHWYIRCSHVLCFVQLPQDL